MRFRKPPGSSVALDVPGKQILQLLDICVTLIGSRFVWLDANHAASLWSAASIITSGDIIPW